MKRKTITKRSWLRTPAAFTLIELLVVIAIISLLVSILLPSLNRAKDLARGVVCMTNLRNLNTASILYSQEHGGAMLRDGRFSGHRTNVWTYAIRSYLGDQDLASIYYSGGDVSGYSPLKALICPNAAYDISAAWETTLALASPLGGLWTVNRSWNDWYGYDKYILQENVIHPDNVVYYMDCDNLMGTGSRSVNAFAWANGSRDPAPTLRHSDKANVAWADGSVGALDYDGLHLDEVNDWWNPALIGSPWDPFDE